MRRRLKFIRHVNGEVKVVANEPFTVDLSELKTDIAQAAQSVIRIVDKNGYTYVYGGDINALDLTYHLEPKPTMWGLEQYYKGKHINAWNLTKIVAPNGREMIFSYLQDSNKIGSEKYHFFNNANYYPLLTDKPTIYNENSIQKYGIDCDYGFKDQYSSKPPCAEPMKLNPNPQVEGVGDTPPNQFSDIEDDLDYQIKNCPLFTVVRDDNNKTAVLSKIQILDIGFEIKFNYSYKYLNTIVLQIGEEPIKTCTLTRTGYGCKENNPNDPEYTEFGFWLFANSIFGHNL